MKLIQEGFECAFELEIFYNIFFDKDEAEVKTVLSHDDKNIDVFVEIKIKDGEYKGDYTFPFYPAESKKRYLKRNLVCAVTKAFCQTAKKIRDIKTPWGVLSGIRPAKVVSKYHDAGFSYDEIKKILTGLYDASEEKADLAITVSKNERSIVEKIKNNSVSVYIGIPFCPSRCGYCSFVSSDIRVSGKYMGDFCSLLSEEIKKTREIMDKTNTFAQTVYIGGGTPTALDYENFEKVLYNVKKYLIDERTEEFTVEAGRPDTIDIKKLFLIEKYSGNRISINPQTLNDETLSRIGRRHTSKMFFDAFSLAKNNTSLLINTDIIAGLPGEAAEDFIKTLDGISALYPDNITVHSMCIKRAARYEKKDLEDPKEINKMLSYAEKKMRKEGYEPYYMYRQKNISGNLENVGYARDKKFSAYNIDIMEEAQTIIALGGGGASKIVSADRIERIFNFKEPYEYITRFNEIIERKDKTLLLMKEGM